MESIQLFLTIILLSSSLLSYVIGRIFDKDNLQKSGKWLLYFSFILLSYLLILRWINIGRPPIYGTYESMLLASFAILLIYFLLRIKNISGDVFIPIVAVLSIFFLAYGAFSEKSPAKLGPAFKSLWLWFHIGFAWLAFSAFFIAAIFAGLYLARKQEKGIYDNISFKLIIFGFISHSIEIGAGALWAYDLYGRYWGWDPIETWSLIVWIIYALYIHLRVTLGWDVNKLAVIAVLAPIAILILYGGIIFLKGIHTPLI